jgi:hypothetical protein
MTTAERGDVILFPFFNDKCGVVEGWKCLGKMTMSRISVYFISKQTCSGLLELLSEC